MSYRILITGTLTQDSALRVCAEPGQDDLDDYCYRDGQNRLTIRGTGLAGAMVSLARKIGYSDTQLGCISARPSASDRPTPSRWRVYTTHPCVDQNITLEQRANVGIRHDTGARAGGVLFDSEVIPRATRWPFLLEITPDSEGLALGVAIKVLAHWQAGRCWLGSDVARGLGWLTLSQLRIVELSDEHKLRWPNSRLPSLQAKIDAISALAGTSLNIQSVPASPPPAVSAWHFSDFTARAKCGLVDGEFRLLAIGSHERNLFPAASVDAQVLPPRKMSHADFKAQFKPDKTLALTTPTDAVDAQPFIPGSSFAGPARHALTRRLRADGKTALDPNRESTSHRDSLRKKMPANYPASDPPTDDVSIQLFGLVSGDQVRGSALLIRDGQLLNGACRSSRDSWQVVMLHHHAEDEFIASTFAGAKFDSLAVNQGEFEMRFFLEAENAEELDQLIAAWKPIQALAAAGHLAIGGGAKQGCGALAWAFSEHQPTSYFGAQP